VTVPAVQLSGFADRQPISGMWKPGAALPSSGQRAVTVFNRV
jgi:hypothetical protein